MLEKYSFVLDKNKNRKIHSVYLEYITRNFLFPLIAGIVFLIISVLLLLFVNVSFFKSGIICSIIAFSHFLLWVIINCLIRAVLVIKRYKKFKALNCESIIISVFEKDGSYWIANDFKSIYIKQENIEAIILYKDIVIIKCHNYVELLDNSVSHLFKNKLKKGRKKVGFAVASFAGTPISFAIIIIICSLIAEFFSIKRNEREIFKSDYDSLLVDLQYDNNAVLSCNNATYRGEIGLTGEHSWGVNQTNKTYFLAAYYDCYYYYDIETNNDISIYKSTYDYKKELLIRVKNSFDNVNVISGMNNCVLFYVRSKMFYAHDLIANKEISLDYYSLEQKNNASFYYNEHNYSIKFINEEKNSITIKRGDGTDYIFSLESLFTDLGDCCISNKVSMEQIYQFDDKAFILFKFPSSQNNITTYLLASHNWDSGIDSLVCYRTIQSSWPINFIYPVINK